jgi:hypothetical protein
MTGFDSNLSNMKKNFLKRTFIMLIFDHSGERVWQPLTPSASLMQGLRIDNPLALAFQLTCFQFSVSMLHSSE